jgi:membrane associated rhomboid family serine protease
VTTTLVIANGCLYYGLSDDTVQRFMFPPSGDPSLLHVLLSVLTHAFLHADAGHLWGNMLFLWAFGCTLEPRIGTRSYLIAYGLGIVFSTVLPVLLLIVQAVHRATLSELTVYSTLGASGAISCIMGLFIVRCYFARVSMSFPFLFLPFLSLSLRLQAILFAGLFFTFDIAGSVRQFADDAGGVDYWAHVGGYVGGFGLAYLWHIHQAAAKEAVQVKAARLRGHLIRGNEAARLYAEILEEDPENEAALRYFLHWYKRSSKKAADYYVRLIQVLLRTDIRQAIDVFDTYFPRHMYALPGAVLFRFGTYFYHEGEFVKAGHCLDMAAERPGPWQPKAMLLLGKTLEALGNDEDATQLYQAVAEQYPESAFQAAALEKLAAIPGLGSGATKHLS